MVYSGKIPNMLRLNAGRLISVFFFLILFCQVNIFYGQSGHLFIKNYGPDMVNWDNRIFSIAQGTNGVMYFANAKGVISYDGSSWSTIETYSTPYVLKTLSNSNKILVGGNKDFGYIVIDKNGDETYFSLSKGLSCPPSISKILVSQNSVYYYGKDEIYIYSISRDKLISKIQASFDDHFTGAFIYQESFYFISAKDGLKKVQGNKFKRVKVDFDFSDFKLVSQIPVDENKILLCTDNSDFYIFNGNTLQDFTPKSIDYLKETRTVNISNLDKNMFAVGTLFGGCVIINKNTGETVAIINHQTGLEDDEIYSMAKDNIGGLWLAHNRGMSRVDYYLPIKVYSEYVGLQGNILSSLNFNNDRYVATSKGVYLLSELDKKEVKVYVKEKPTTDDKTLGWKDRMNENNQPVCDTLVKKNDEEETSEKKSKGLFGWLKRKLKGKEKNSSEEDTPEPEKIHASDPTDSSDREPVKQKSVIRVIYKTVKVDYPNHYLQESVKYGYKKVSGIEGKCKQLIALNNKLLAVTSSAIYEISGSGAKRILERNYINTVYRSDLFYNVLYVGTENGVLAMKNGKVIWDLTDIGLPVHSISEDHHNELWLGSETEIIKILMDENGNPGKQDMYSLQSGYSDKINVRRIIFEQYIFTSNDIYTYDRNNNQLIPVDNFFDFIYKENFRILNSSDGYTWIFNGKEWRGFPKNDEKTLVNNYLNLFSNINSIGKEEKFFYIVDGHQNLYKIITDSIYPYQSSLDIYLRTIKNFRKRSLPLANLTLDHDSSSVNFKFTSPYYLNENAIQYQHRLSGIMNDWSDWSNSGIIVFPYLPEGKYVLEVRSKNIFGTISKTKEVRFGVNPPYWMTWWFLLIEIGVVFSLLVLSIFLNTAKEGHFWSKSLMLLTVVIIFKFLQATIHSYISTTPVINFIISVAMVFAILKVEKIVVKALITLCRNLKAGSKRRMRNKKQTLLELPNVRKLEHKPG